MSESENIKIIKTFLANAPPGEYEQCTAALRSIVNDEDLINRARSETLKTWAEEECIVVDVEDHKVIICKEACQRDGIYVDPVTSSLITYDFESRIATPIGDQANMSDFAKELQEELTAYAKNAYKENAAAGVYDTNNGIVIVLRGSSISLKNFRTGKTVAKYTLSKSGSLEGKIVSIQHFFEKGNAVCQHDGDCNTTCSFGDAKSVVKAIRTFEDEWLADYKTTLEKIGTNVLFQLRRKFPYSKQKINWQQEITVGGGMKC
ncbi:F-actin capping protein alpha subunit, putative [Trichomonas vaginalis G3]|uniref:F-actin-capping protein subunit alpha n=1 Tax=Trichomonas vaginalis (strain ATCC PRA-98 / G3) TaxID=412133 RepID=A2FE30_TRIV3|nr:barbed-end actin filament capping [Trichomonas vaginalis G3]XP_001309789.1 barbed-end actin filament capping [Trichomonas vaginalis G3]EAX96858.1 F-actin capping protein alpha subunit, putative [Trichomonas vaginalis G3]EAX96859.1 F-actin capping protein alpha subunit, putative [Trichomonas vaginalis G3]KAI5520676.1 barbed-end actin filament capping [Trichomonas vaginalis G3]KAI5520677.1 barbed-end actin filament capping [Trichomonas vaginalis G3]|eukprot:XP_001309788.1 F-actin capping protein alpha subunit [Trichomonas vaginalis G3]